jgi:MFS family permease
VAGFFGWRVVGAAFVLAIFGWGLGFHGLGVYLQTVRDTRGFPLAEISLTVTLHFLAGAIVTANTPALYDRFGLPAVTRTAALVLALGVFGWAVAAAPWQLFIAALVSGAGWAAMSNVVINAVVAPWFVRARPAALGTAYNGASVAGLIFSPLWATAILVVGFPLAAAIIGTLAVIVTWFLAGHYFARTPVELGVAPDGDTPGAPAQAVTSLRARPLLWCDLTFLTLAAGAALTLFAQIGLIAHLYSLMVPTLGREWAGIVMGIGTGCGMVGRVLVGWLMPIDADRRLVACLSCAVQIGGTLVLATTGGTTVAFLLLGVMMFGIGVGNAISLPPLIAQVEFVKEDFSRVVALLFAIGQAIYAFAPAMFGLIRQFAPQESAVFFAAALIQMCAIGALLLGRYAMKSVREYP